MPDQKKAAKSDNIAEVTALDMLIYTINSGAQKRTRTSTPYGTRT